MKNQNVKLKMGSFAPIFLTAFLSVFAIASFVYAVTTISTSITTDGAISVSSGTVTAPSYTFIGDTNTGIFRDQTDVMTLVANGARILSVTGTNVGIGTTNPGTTLDIVGSMRASTFADADAYRVTNNALLASSQQLIKATLQGASHFPVSTAGGVVDIDLSDAAMDAGDIGRVITFALVSGTNLLSVTAGAGIIQVVTIAAAGTGTTNVEDSGDYIRCLIWSTTQASCTLFGAD